jgi:curved DNA-binding protein CbpA
MDVTHYQRLGVEPDCEFAALRKAYYAQVKLCHPDRYPNNPTKAEAFRRLVEAFNVLSDPVTRAAYDARWQAERRPLETQSVLDRWADDILEEMIVGNTYPAQTHLQTLMLDLEQTERFMLLREAKTAFYRGQTEVARQLFERYLVHAPTNLIALYYVGRCHVRRRRYRQAARVYRRAIRIGAARTPPLQLARIRHELLVLRRTHLGWWSRWLIADAAAGWREELPVDEAMRRDVARAMNRLWRTHPGRVWRTPRGYLRG